MSFDKLINKVYEKQNPTVAGLDPKLDYIPKEIVDESFEKYGQTMQGAAEAILEYNKGLIDAISDIVPAVKPQSAFYEMYGYHGVKTLHDTINYAKQKGMYVIADAKRGDIGSTMDSYAAAYLGVTRVGDNNIEAFGGDSLTVNPYAGEDTINSVLSVCKEYDKGMFVLVKMSNPSSGQLQDRIFDDGKTLYDTVGELCEQWGKQDMGQYGYSGVGAVIGATYPAQLGSLRKKLKNTFFLVPGYGAQGGGAAEIVPGFDKNGLGAIVNASRSIICAWKNPKYSGMDYKSAAAAEAVNMRDSIMKAIGEIKLP